MDTSLDHDLDVNENTIRARHLESTLINLLEVLEIHLEDETDESRDHLEKTVSITRAILDN